MKSHPAAEMFPLMAGDDLRELADDIKQNGLLEPIVTHEGLILDGRNRYAACNLVGAVPRMIPWDGKPGSPTLYVVAKNLHRRQLTLAQRASIGVEMLPMLQAEAKKRQQQGGLAAGRGRPLQVPVTLPEPIKGESYDLAAKAVQVGASSIGRARQVKEADPKAFDRLKRGETTVNEEYRKVRTTPEPKRPSIATGKRLSVRQDAHKRGMEESLSGIRGICTALSGLDITLIKARCTQEEIKTWAEIARRLSAEIRRFAVALENGKNGSEQQSQTGEIDQ